VVRVVSEQPGRHSGLCTRFGTEDRRNTLKPRSDGAQIGDDGPN
jgi:hypothetical protein